MVLLRRGEGGRTLAERLPYAAYLADRHRLPPHLLREVVVKKGGFDLFAVARLAMVRFDYAACRLALAARLVDGRLEQPRFWLAGTRGRLSRLEAAEQAAAGRRPDAETARRAAEAVEAAFASDPRFSAGYKLRWTRAALRDALLALGKGGER